MDKDIKRVVFEVSRSIHRKLKIKTAKDDITIKELITKMISKYLGEEA